MSTFAGTFASLPGVSCDKFGGINLNSDQFFLSHCHADHMSGLDLLTMDLRGRNTVKVNHRIYCSMISKAFLIRKYPQLDEKFVRNIGQDPIEIDVFDRGNSSMYKLRVTAIPANHCPGSVMFLFEKLDSSSLSIVHRILYTGDFRFENVPLNSIQQLHLEGQAIEIDEMFLDTTFCSPQYPSFPSRMEAMRKIWEIINSWVRKNGIFRKQRAKHVVLLHLPAQYGSEAILNHIYEQSGFNWKIHVSDRKFQDYICTEDLSDCTDSDSRSKAQWIHACSWKRGGASSAKTARYHENQKLPCQQGQFEVCHIRPSAMYFCRERIKDLEEKTLVSTGENYYRVCYSCHSSLQELLDFVRHFQPKRIVPCVIPKDMTMETILDTFRPVMNDASQVSLNDTQELLGHLSSLSPVGNEDDLSLSLSDDFLKSPSSSPRRKRRAVVSVDTDVSAAKRSLLFKEDEINENEMESDEDIFDDTKPSKAKSRRLMFKQSKSNYSMPSTCTSTPVKSETCQHNRRASLPHNLKIPAIIITRSSPSPDPNHPDYPEFFEEPLYIETRNITMSSSSESITQRASSQESNLSLVLSPEKHEDNEANKEDLDSSVEICFESLVQKREDNVDEEAFNSTPDFEEIQSKASSEEEKRNCINFAKSMEKETT